MSVELLNFIETVLNGLMSGIMYSLVALGFVLIFKASGVFNFAQGVFALFAALTLVGFQTGQVPFSHLINELFGTKFHHWYPEIHSFLAIILTIITMIVLAWIIERLVLKHLVNRLYSIHYYETQEHPHEPLKKILNHCHMQWITNYDIH